MSSEAILPESGHSSRTSSTRTFDSTEDNSTHFHRSDSSVDRTEQCDVPFERTQQCDGPFERTQQCDGPFELTQQCERQFEHTDQCDRNFEYGQCKRLVENKGRIENRDKEAFDPLCSSGKRRFCCGNMCQCVWGVVLIILTISGFIVTPLDIMLWEKLNMRPGLPPYEWWADPPDEVKLRMYVFNVTNHDRFLAGVDTKLDMAEIGPIVYLEKLIHTNITFNLNSTMTYTATRVPIYLPQENTINLNDTIIVPNMAILGLQSYLHNAPFLVKTAFNLLVRSQQSPLFVRRTIYEYLWDYTDPVLDVSKNLAPGLVPVSNMGMLARVYADFVDQVTVKVGHRWGHRQFFQIDRFRGHPQIPGYDPNTCPDRLSGSTEGVMYQQQLTKRDVLLYWRKTVCKLMPLYFDSELRESSMVLYRYNLSDSVFERTNGTDCYDTVPSLPPGISDASKCYYDFPMVVSYPHFFTGRVGKDQFVTGMKPDRAKHNSYVIVEPQTGIPFYSVARMQSNLRVHDLSGFGGEYRKFSNSIVPLFWAEYNQEGLPPRIQWTIFFMSTVLSPLSNILFSMTFLLGLYLITKYIIHVTKIRNDTLKAIILLRTKNVNTLAKNKIFTYEKEAFLKRPQ